MRGLKALAPLGFVALVCLPCLAVGLAAAGGVLTAVAATLLSPSVGIPLAAVGLAALLFGGSRLGRRRRRCGHWRGRH